MLYNAECVFDVMRLVVCRIAVTRYFSFLSYSPILFFEYVGHGGNSMCLPGK